MALEDSRRNRQPVPRTGPSLGAWEWVALPELGISCMKARLAAGGDASVLAITDLVSIELAGAPGLQFRIYPLPDDPRTFVLAEAPLAQGPQPGRGPRIRTLLSLGERSWQVELELVARAGDSPALTLGPSAFGGRLAVDAGSEAAAGLPRLWPVAFDPDAEDR